MVKETVIKGEVIGELTDELKRDYARALARALIAEYGKEKCEAILERLKKS